MCVYADDIFSLNKTKLSMNELLDLFDKITAKYGLSINKRKCKFCITAEDELKFMGITHTKLNKIEATIAYQLLNKAIDI